MTLRKNSDRGLAVSVYLTENEPGYLRVALRKTDAFNKDAGAQLLENGNKFTGKIRERQCQDEMPE